MYRLLVARDVNICLIPKAPFHLYGNGFLDFLFKQLEIKKYCVIVVGEGACDTLIDYQVEKGFDTDKSGNLVLPDIGLKKYASQRKIFRLK